MESTLHPLDYQALAREALDGGFTQALDGFRPTRGYVVSTRKDAERTLTAFPSGAPSAHVIADALYHYVTDHGHDLRRGYLLGAWRDGDRVVLDLVQVFEDRDDAMRAARANGQDAIYDVTNATAIDVPAQGWVPQDNEGAKSADDAVSELFAQMTTDEIRALAESEPTTGWPELVRELAIEELDRK